MVFLYRLQCFNYDSEAYFLALDFYSVSENSYRREIYREHIYKFIIKRGAVRRYRRWFLVEKKRDNMSHECPNIIMIDGKRTRTSSFIIDQMLFANWICQWAIVCSARETRLI